MFGELADAIESICDFVRAVIGDCDLPLSVGAAGRTSRRIIANTEAFAPELATRNEAVDLLMSANLIRDQNSGLTPERGVFGSSVNGPQARLKFAFEVVESDTHQRVGFAVAESEGWVEMEHAKTDERAR